MIVLIEDIMGKIKEIYYSFLRAFFADVPTSLYKLLLFGLIVYSVLPVFFYNNTVFYRVYYYLSYLTISILVICAITYFPLKSYLKKYYLRIQTKKLKTEHLAIIIVRYNIIYKTLFYLLTHFKKLFAILNQNHIPYVVYVINTNEEFINILKNRNVKAIFVFGHGRRHGLKFGNEVWSYNNLSVLAPKLKHIIYVGQFHCNHESGKSLYEQLDCDGTLTEGVTLCYDINDYIDSRKYISILKGIFGVKKTN